MRLASYWCVLLLVAVGCGDDGDGPAPDASAADGASEPSPVGGPCLQDRDCVAGLECLSGPEGARAWPGGYCTRACEGSAECPGESRCGVAWFEGESAQSRCLAPCERIDGERGGCRDGYECAYDGVCVVGCTSDVQCQSRDSHPEPRPPRDESFACELSSARCGRPGGWVPAGGACGTDAECAGSGGICVAGMCLVGHCDLGGDNACPEDSQCIAFPSGGDPYLSLCVPSCSLDDTSRCPAGTGCWPQEADISDRATSGYCSLVLVGGSTPDGTMDVPCSARADCPNPYGLVDCIDGQCAGLFCAAPSISGLPDVCPAGGTCRTEEPPAGADRLLARLLELGLCAP